VNIKTNVTVTSNINGAPVNPIAALEIDAPVMNFGDNTTLVTNKNVGSGMNFGSGGSSVLRPLTMNLQGTTHILVGDGTGKSRVNVLLANGTLPSTQTLTLQSVDQNGSPSTDTHNLVSNAPFLINLPNGTFVDNHVAFTTSTPKPNTSA